jgi:sterol desaturase/sphingolipid hydroxylase (fatty acid hydroxylase superfamily)
VLRAEHDSNYGAVFSVWDRLFGTLQEREPTAIGLADGGDRDFIELLKYGLTAGVAPVKAPALVPVRAKRVRR